MVDFGGMFGVEVFGVNGVGEIGDFLFILFDDSDSEDGEIGIDDVVVDGFVFVFISVVGVVVGVVVGEEEVDMGRGDNILFYWEILFVVVISDVEDVVFLFIVKGIGRDFSVYLIWLVSNLVYLREMLGILMVYICFL